MRGILPNIKVHHFNAASAGDLFMFRHQDGDCVGFVAEYDDGKDVEKFAFSLGPDLISGIGRKLFKFSDTVVSVGKEFHLLLPTTAQDWKYDETRDDQQFLMVVEDKAYFKANGFAGDHRTFNIFMNLSSGEILIDQNRVFIRPPGTAAFPIRWQLTTCEVDPRIIFSHHP